MLTGRTVARINNRPRKVNRLPLLAIGGGSAVLAALLYALLALPLLALVVLLAGILGVVGVYRAHKTRAITSLSYKGKLEEEASARFAEVSEALEALASSQKSWHLTGTLGRPSKAQEAATTPPRQPAWVGLLPTPGIRSDLPVWGIEAGEQSIFFFPEGALLYKDDHYEPLPYDLLKMTISSVPFYEKEEVPDDVKVIAEPSERSRMPIVLYTLVEIGLLRGLGITLLVSSREAAARFARTFGVESRKSPREWGQGQDSSQRPEEKAERTGSAYRHPPAMTEGASIASAYATLGVARGASTEQINAAYRRLARAHHPDKVANESPQIRERSERRMKEINAAYTLLKRPGNGSSTTEAWSG